MTFLTLVLALLLERMLPRRLPRTHRWFDTYWQRVTGVGWLRELLARPWAIVLALLPPLALLALLQGLSDPFGSLGALLFGVLVLHYSLGPDELSAQADEFVRARDAGDQVRASALAQQFCLSEIPEEEPRRSFAVARAVVVLACRRLVGPVFWFVILGPLGAAAYRLVHLLAARLDDEPVTPEMRRYGEAVRDLADWAPARVTAAGYAVAGNFDAVAHAWRHFEYQPGEDRLGEGDQLLAQTGLGALDTFPSDADELAGATELGGIPLPVPPVVEDALALVWRSLVVWLALIAGGSLVAWIS